MTEVQGLTKRRVLLRHHRRGGDGAAFRDPRGALPSSSPGARGAGPAATPPTASILVLPLSAGGGQPDHASRPRARPGTARSSPTPGRSTTTASSPTGRRRRSRTRSTGAGRIRSISAWWTTAARRTSSTEWSSRTRLPPPPPAPPPDDHAADPVQPAAPATARPVPGGPRRRPDDQHGCAADARERAGAGRAARSSWSAAVDGRPPEASRAHRRPGRRIRRLEGRYRAARGWRSE